MNFKVKNGLFLLFILLFSCSEKEVEVIYSESDVPDYELPELLRSTNGNEISNYNDWRNSRRPEILSMFSEYVYGAYPDMDYTIEFSEKILDTAYLGGKAFIKETTAEITTEKGSGNFSILYVFPKNKKSVPVFVALNFGGNQTLDTLPSIHITEAWIHNSKTRNITQNKATEDSRGAAASRWPLSTIIDHGFGVATAYYGEIDPDFDDGFENGFHPLFQPKDQARDKSSTASISMWAKGMSFILDYLEHDSIADPTRIIALGHSRLGKTSLWAGANDERFAAVISNNSGCGGAALSRREFGETVARINTVFPHWFCDAFKKYNKKINKLPVDQHMLLALMAPRPVYVASATEDQWADPHGEFLALKAATPVYALADNYETLLPEEMPQADRPIHSKTAYHLRTGKHDITEFDWIMYMNWAEKWLGE